MSREDQGEFATRFLLQRLRILVLVTAARAGQEPPLELSRLVTWLAKNVPDHVSSENEELRRFTKREKSIDIDAGTILDAWGNPIMVIAYDGKASALGSKGPDGQWNDGAGDDIVRRLD